MPCGSLSTLPVLTTRAECAYETTRQVVHGTPEQRAETTLSRRDEESSESRREDGQVRLNPVFHMPPIRPENVKDFARRFPSSTEAEFPTIRADLQREEGEIRWVKDEIGLTDNDLIDFDEILSERRRQRTMGALVGCGRDERNDIRERPFLKLSAAPPKKGGRQLRKSCGSSRKNRSCGTGSSGSEGIKRRKGSSYGRAEFDCITSKRSNNTTHGTRRDFDRRRTTLQHQLHHSLSSLQNISESVKSNLLALPKLCRSELQLEHYEQARKQLKLWGIDLIVKLMDGKIAKLSAFAFRRWKNAIREQKFAMYQKYKCIWKIDAFHHHILRKKVAASWMIWIELVESARRKERFEMESRAATAVQLTWRIHKAKVVTNAKRVQKREDSAIVIQRRARGMMDRTYHRRKVLERAASRAALRIQCAARVKASKAISFALRKRRQDHLYAIAMQRALRGHIGRQRARKQRIWVQRKAAATDIQRMLRGGWGRADAKNRLLFVKREAAALLIQTRSRGHLSRKLLIRLRREKETEERMKNALCVALQKVYRGHRGRVMMKLQMKTHVAIVRRRHKAATRLQCWTRSIRAADIVERRRNDLRDRMMVDSRLWRETWSEDANAWFYYNSESNESLWEPPATGYTKLDGRLVLRNGKVMDDPLLDPEQEKGGNATENPCVDCEKEAATRLCDQCGDHYCTACFLNAHPKGGKRESHTFLRVGPVDCEECGAALAIKWCSVCDDPFCEDCWNAMHKTGNRAFHSYYKVHADGSVSPRAWEADGSAYANPDYAGASGVSDIQTLSNADSHSQWSAHYDENGYLFFYNELTGESTYEHQMHSNLDES